VQISLVYVSVDIVLSGGEAHVMEIQQLIHCVECKVFIKCWMLVIDICVMHVTDVCSHMSSAVADSDADDSSKLQTNHNR